MFRFLSRLPVLGVSLAMTGCSTGPEPGPAAMFDAYMRDIATRDVDTVMAHFADDMEAEFSPEYVIPREAMRRVLSFDFAVNSRTEHTVIAESDHSVEVEMVENNDLLSLIDVRNMQVRLRVDFREGKIVRQTMLDLSFTGPTMDEAMVPFMAWARDHAPEQYAIIHGNAGPIYTGESAPVWLALARQWKNATGR